MIYILVFLSGLAALVYQVIWARQLATFIGITAHANTVVLASFMLGLGLGSWLLGRRADRVRSPLLLFARLEAGIGLFGLATLALVPLLQRVYVTIGPESASSWSANLVRLLMAAAILLPPTFLMGGTLPALVRGLGVGKSPVAGTLAALYAVNTLGAAFGALVTGYGLLPTLGVRRSLLVAVTANLAVALGTVIWRSRAAGPSRRPPPDQDRAPLEPALTGSRRWLLLLAFAVSGAVAMALQLGWIRALTQTIGSSVYAFALTTACYLVGLACGGGLATVLAAWISRHRATIRLAATLEVGIGLSALAGLPVLERLPELFLLGYRLGVHESFVRLQVFVFGLAGAVVLVPTLLLGALYPLLAARLPRHSEETASGIGFALAANAAGTVLGTLFAGLVLLPHLGAHGLLSLAAVVSAGVAALLLVIDTPRPRASRFGFAAIPLAVLALAVAMPSWDPAIVTSGPFINAARFADVPPGRQLREWLQRRSRILYYREGLEGTVTVRDVGDERLLVINGKTDGSRFGDRRTQLALAHIPILSHSDPRRVLLIGLGTGMSAAAAAAHPEISELTVVELSPEVIEASAFFTDENESVLTDPRLRIERADGRNFLLTSRGRFDVILSEPSNPWITGVANLFTREFFQLARARLAPGGIMAQWFQTYGMSAEDLDSVLRSFAEAFPHVTVWSPQLGDLLFIGSLEQTSLPDSRLTAILNSARGRAQLESIDLDDAAALAALFLLDDPGVRRLTAHAAPNTDDRPRVEFNAPRNLYAETTLPNLAHLIAQSSGRDLRAPIRSGRRTRSNADQPILEVAGIALRMSQHATALAEWRVNWTTLVAVEEASQSVGISARQAIVLRDGDSRIDIEASHDPTPQTPARLESWVRSRLPELEIGPTTTILSGQPAVTARGREPKSVTSAVAWSCGAREAGFSRYLATIESTDRSPRIAADRLTTTVRCTNQTP